MELRMQLNNKVKYRIFFASLFLFNVSSFSYFLIKLNPWNSAKIQIDLLTKIKNDLTSCQKSEFIISDFIQSQEVVDNQEVIESPFKFFYPGKLKEKVFIVENDVKMNQAICISNIENVFFTYESFSHLNNSENINNDVRVSIRALLRFIRKPLFDLVLVNIISVIIFSIFLFSSGGRFRK